jgi:hypothetical protein
MRWSPSWQPIGVNRDLRRTMEECLEQVYGSFAPARGVAKILGELASNGSAAVKFDQLFLLIGIFFQMEKRFGFPTKRMVWFIDNGANKGLALHRSAPRRTANVNFFRLVDVDPLVRLARCLSCRIETC